MQDLDLVVVDLAREMLLTVLMIAGPVLIAGLVVGVSVSLFQALTSVQEQTLSLVPKMMAVGDINMTEINTSFDWAGGGLVSNNQDQAKFIKALFNHELISKSSLNKMIDVQFTKEYESRYGLGIYESIYKGDTFYGHYGFYGSYIGYCPKTKMVLSYNISQAEPDFNVYSFIVEVLNLTVHNNR